MSVLRSPPALCHSSHAPILRLRKTFPARGKPLWPHNAQKKSKEKDASVVKPSLSVSLHSKVDST